jgi:phage terminase large subunit
MLEISEPKSVIAGVDFGYTNPAVILVVAIDNDDIFYVVDEFYRSGLTIKELITKGSKLRNKYKIEIFFADPSQPAYIREMNNEGLYTVPAKNDILPGISAVSEKLKIKQDGRPSLFIDKKCKRLIYELENYKYAEKERGNGAFAEIPVKKDDHACDALRYAVYSMKKMFKPKSFRPKWL